jgi:hypothetical protein
VAPTTCGFNRAAATQSLEIYFTCIFQIDQTGAKRKKKRKKRTRIQAQQQTKLETSKIE